MACIRTACLLLSLCGGALAAAPIYDHVIAGAGTSGLLLAVALTRNASVSVAILEAGPDDRSDPRITDPLQEGAIENTGYDWQFMSVPQKGTYGGRSMVLNRGKVLGGTSAMNYMIWNTGSTVEYDAWQNVLGNQGWNWTTMDAAIKAAEHFLAPINGSTIATYNSSYHGMSGPIFTTMQNESYSIWGQYLEPTLRNLGVAIQVDKCGGNNTGAAPVPLSIVRDSYTRSYSASAYTAVQGRPNLHVYTNATVSKVLWRSTADGQALIATGLGFFNTSDNTTTSSTISANSVILSAGSLKTPQILELSGIGDPSVLSAAGVAVKVNLTAVGTQLQDKLTYAGGFSFNVSGIDFGAAQTFLDYAQPSRFLSAQDLATLKILLSSAKPSPSLSNTTLSLVRYLVAQDQPIIENGWYGNFVNTYLLHPLSTGSVHINSSDHLAQPSIDPAYNTAVANGTQIDLWILSRAIQYLAKVLATAKPFSTISAQYSVSNSLNISQIQNAVYQGLGQGQHLTGGAVMLPRASGGVVDTSMLVYGTANLRVVDSSIFPAEPGHHPQSLAYAAAMRAASILSQVS